MKDIIYCLFPHFESSLLFKKENLVHVTSYFSGNILRSRTTKLKIMHILRLFDKYFPSTHQHVLTNLHSTTEWMRMSVPNTHATPEFCFELCI